MKHLFFLIFAVASFAAEDISGFWKSYTNSGTPQCIFGVYSYEGTFYGRIIATYNDEGQIKDTIYKPVGRAEGIIDNPFTCGLDIIYGLQDNGSRFAGKIVAPDSGKIYNCEMWLNGDLLILRGKLFMFGKNMTWYPAVKADFPKDFQLPDMKKFVPTVPQPN